MLVEQCLCESCMFIHNIWYLIQKATSVFEEFLNFEECQKTLYMRKGSITTKFVPLVTGKY